MVRTLVPESAERLAKLVLGEAYRLHTDIGPGCLENVYKRCLAAGLIDQGHEVVIDQYLPLVYRGLRIDPGYKPDLLVGQDIVVETKACGALTQQHVFQAMTYVRLTSRPIGLLLNFGEAHLRDGIVRITHPAFEAQFDRE